MKNGERLLRLEAVREKARSGIVVVYFYEDDCPVCDEFWETWKIFKDMHRGEVTFIEVNLSGRGRRLFRRLRIRYVPTVVFAVNDVELDRLEGAAGINDLEALLNAAKNEYRGSMR